MKETEGLNEESLPKRIKDRRKRRKKRRIEKEKREKRRKKREKYISKYTKLTGDEKKWLNNVIKNIESKNTHWEDRQNLRNRVKDFNRQKINYQEIKKRKKKDKKQRDEWLKSYSDNTSLHDYDNIWRDNRKKQRDNILNIASKSYSSVDGANIANEIIRIGLNMSESPVDTSVIVEYCTKFSRIRMAEELIKSHDIKGWRKDQIIQKIIEKEFPSKNDSVKNELKRVIENIPQENPYGKTKKELKEKESRREKER